MADSSIPSRDMNEGTVSIFPQAEADVPAPPPDELNAHAWELQAENAKGGPAMDPKPDWSTK
jgi:hypothetical protein